MKKKMMFKIPLLSLAIWLLFLISPLSHSLSHALQDDTVVEPLLPVRAEFSEPPLEEETLVGFDAIGLRKMGNGRKRGAVKRIMRKETTTNDKREEDQEISRISGANHYDRTCNFEDQKGDFGVSRKNMGVKNCKNAAKKLNVARFVTFGADYKGPLHHPPKHN